MQKQENLPGEEFETIPELDDLIAVLNDHRTKRLHHLSEEKKASDSLLAAMHRHKVTTYGDKEIGTFAEIVPGEEKVKVKAKSETKTEEPEEAA